MTHSVNTTSLVAHHGVPRRLLFGFLLVAVALLSTAAPESGRASGVSGAITGRVFQDFNSNGIRDTTVAIGRAVDVGVAGIEVRGFDSSGAVVGSTSTGADGTYTLAITSAATALIRVEFTVAPGTSSLTGLRSSFATGTGASGEMRLLTPYI